MQIREKQKAESQPRTTVGATLELPRLLLLLLLVNRKQIGRRTRTVIALLGIILRHSVEGHSFAC